MSSHCPDGAPPFVKTAGIPIVQAVAVSPPQARTRQRQGDNVDGKDCRQKSHLTVSAPNSRGEETAPMSSSSSIHKTACDTLHNNLNSLREATVRVLEFSYDGRCE